MHRLATVAAVDEPACPPPRHPLAARLESLLSSSSASSTAPSSSLPSPPSPRLRDSAMHPSISIAITRASHPLPRLHFSPPSPMHADGAATPIVRWLSSWSSTPSRSPTHSRSRSESPSSRSEPPSPCLSSLSDALSSPIPRLPAKPSSAHLPSSFYAPGSLSRPPFLDNLTRSTLPTASLTRAIPLSTNTRAPPPTISYASPSRSSIDTLRTVCDRGIHTSASAHIDPTPKSNWWWSQGENKQNVDSLLHEDDRADTAQEEHDQIRRKYRTPKNPIVFCHGLLGFDSVSIGPAIAPVHVTHWRGIKEVLEANGAEVLITRVPATSSVEDRAKVLEQRISDVYPGRSVHLIGHSMGGLDCRYLTSHLPLRTFKVLSVTTIATPHRGSSFADHFLSTIGPSRLPSVLSLLDLLPNGGGDGKAFECLTLESMRAFNEEVQDAEGVRYFSWGATYEPGLIDTWKWPHTVIMEKEGPNDGLVSVESSKWGTYLGTLQDVNHLDLVGWINTARYKWAEMFGKDIKFRPATFYLGVADWLAGEVEGQPKKGEGGEEEEGKSPDSRSSDRAGSELDESMRKAGPLVTSTLSPQSSPHPQVDSRKEVASERSGGELDESMRKAGEVESTTSPTLSRESVPLSHSDSVAHQPSGKL